MNTLRYVSMAIIAINLIACGGSATKDNSSETTTDETKNCTLTCKDGSVGVTWTAFKTTEKIGVSGTFDTVRVAGVSTGNTLADVFGKATFNIPVASVNSANPDRDKKIMEHFFGTMTETTVLSGNVVEVADGACKVAIAMNGVTDTLNFSLSRTDSLVNLSGVMELGNWSALESADALNKVCFDLHKGSDGVSKLWPEVKLEIAAIVTENCN